MNNYQLAAEGVLSFNYPVGVSIALRLLLVAWRAGPGLLLRLNTPLLLDFLDLNSSFHFNY